MTVFVHIGLIKTGSTFLQKHVFPQLAHALSYYGPTARFPDPSLLSLQQSMLISNENLGGNPLSPTKQGVSLFEQFKVCIDATCSIFNRPRLIIGFREPASFVQSVYKQHLHERGVFTWEEFLGHYSTQLVEDVNFQEYIKHAQSRLDPHELFLFRQDELWKRRAALMEELMRFLCLNEVETPTIEPGRAANSSVPLRFENTLRRLNLLNQGFRNLTSKNLGIRIRGKVFNPTFVCRTILPKLIGEGSAERDLSELKRAYAEDWRCASEMISLSRDLHAAALERERCP